MTKKIGLYGGTFDPIHCAHLILAREAMEQLKLAKVVFVPAMVSPHKLEQESAPAALRLEMLQAAIACEAGFEIDELELHRPAPSFTIDTVEEFKRQDPTSQICYLIGSDNVARLNSWHRINEVRELVQFVVLDRGEGAPDSEFVTIHRSIEISATEIRMRVASGQSIRYLVPPAVEEIISRRKLYQESARSPQKN